MRNIFRTLLLLLSVSISSLWAADHEVEIDQSEKAQIVDYSTNKKYVIEDISVVGAEFTSPNIIIATSGMMRGDSIYIPGNYISQAIERLWNQQYFADVRVETVLKGEDKVDLEIHLTERPRIFNWKFEGIRSGEGKDIIKDLKLKRGTSEYSDYVINTKISQIRDYYNTKGFRNADIDVKIDNEPTMSNSVNVTFVIDRKKRVKIKEVNVAGNNVLSAANIKGALKKTHAKDWQFWKSSKFNEDDYENDKVNLIDAYNSKGFRNATIVSDSIYKIGENELGILLNIEEGNKYYFRNINWVGNSKHETQMLDEYLGIKPGDTYDKKTLHQRLGVGAEGNPEQMSITSLYQNDGYLFFQVNPAEEIIGADSIDLTLQIIEGKQATVNEVNISGNMRINEDVIRRELYTRPGELYDRALLMQTLRLLSQMGHFNPEALQPDIKPVSSESVNISFPLEEQASDKFEISGGLGSGMFIGSVGVQLNNISLGELFKKGSWRPYPQGQGQQIAITAQSNGSYYNAASLSFTEPWLGGKKPTSLTVSAHFSSETDSYYNYYSTYVWEESDNYFQTFGLAVGLGRRLSWPDRNFTLYNEIAYKAYFLDDWDYFIMDNGTSNIITFKTVLGRSSVDQTIYPRSGSNFSLSLEFTPPYSLFDGIDYSDEDLTDAERYKWVEYHKWEASCKWFTPVSRDSKLVFMAGFEFGYLGSYNSDKVSPYEGFDVGGDGMSGYNVYGVDIIGLRGYDDGELTPYSSSGDYARAYNKYTLELRYPVVLKPSSTIYGLIFAEAGNAFSSWQEFDPFILKRSVGAGLRLYLPIVGMIGIDWGYGLDYTATGSSASGGQVHFIMGTSF